MNAQNSNKSAAKQRGAGHSDLDNMPKDNANISDFDSGIEVAPKRNGGENMQQLSSMHSRKQSKYSNSRKHPHKKSTDFAATGPVPVMQGNGLGIRDSDFDEDKPGSHQAYRRRLDDSRNEPNLSLYQEAQLEIEHQMRATTAATGNSEYRATTTQPFGSTSEDVLEQAKKLRRDSTFMGSAGEEDEEKKQQHEVIKRFQEKEPPVVASSAAKKQSVIPKIQVATDESESDRRSKQAAKKKKKKKPQPVIDISEEYEKYAMEQEMKYSGKTYIDRPKIREDYDDQQPRVYQQSYRPTNFDTFQQNFYPMPKDPGFTTNRTMRSQRSTFDPQFITTNPHIMMNSTRSRMLMTQESQRSSMLALPQYPDQGEKWVCKPTPQGFLYFHLKSTRVYQWNFPKFFDPEIKGRRPYFVDHWIKKYDNRGKKYWQNMHTKHVQHVKPHSETYLIQAAISGNLAFIELYIKSEGVLTLTDQQRRTALHHAVSNGHKEITAMLCEFSYALIESQDINGCTPAFMAVRYNEAECLKLLISYDCNIYLKMRNGDTALHVAAAYNSLECMILLTNFGGMELYTQKNRYDLKAIEIAKKMRNYECFEVLQKLERNVQYQNSILEREIQSLDHLKSKASKSARTDYMGGPANYPKFSMSTTQRSSKMSSRGGRHPSQRDPMVPPLRLSQIDRHAQYKQKNYQRRDLSDSSVEASDVNLPFEDDDDGQAAYDNLGGPSGGYRKRVQEFERQSKLMRHEKRYMEQNKKDRHSQMDDRIKRGKHSYNLEFDDFRKGRKSSLRRIQEEDSESPRNARRPPSNRMSPSAAREVHSASESDFARMRDPKITTQYREQPSKRSNDQQQQPRQYPDYKKKAPRQQKEDEDEYTYEEVSYYEEEPPPQKKASLHHSREHDVSRRSLRSRHMDSEEEEVDVPRNTSKRAKSASGRYKEEDEGAQYLQRHLASRYRAEGSSVTDEEREGSARRRSQNKSARSSGSMGDPYKVSRQRRNRSRRQEGPALSLVEIAYDKTAAAVTTVKDLLVTGLSKIKGFIAPTRGDRSKSARSRGRGESLTDDSSLDRYRTPLSGRSKSRAAQARGFSKVVPIDGQDYQDMMENDRKRHVNFNINRVAQIQPTTETDENLMPPPLSAKKRTIQIQAEPPAPIKSALRNPISSEKMSTKSVGIGSHNINEENSSQNNNLAFSSNHDQVQTTTPQLKLQTSINSGPAVIQTHVNTEKKGVERGQDPKKKSKPQNFFNKNYLSSEERGGMLAFDQRRRDQAEEADQLSPSSRASSMHKEEPPTAPQTQRLSQGQLITEPTQLTKPATLRPQIPAGRNDRSKSPSAIPGGSKTTLKKRKGSLGLSQEQFDQIMQHSEQEDNWNVPPPPPPVKKPVSQQVIDIVKNCDINKLFDDLNDEHSTPPNKQPQFTNEWPEEAPKKVIETLPISDILQDFDESHNLSNLYERILNAHPPDFAKNSPLVSKQQQRKEEEKTSLVKPFVPPANYLQSEPEVSILTEFNPPTQRIGKDRSKLDLSFQSGISDLRRALEDEEALDNVSDCSFVENRPAAKVVQEASTNLLDRAALLNSQLQNNSLHQSAANTSHQGAQVRHLSVGVRPLANLFVNQNNSMHFNKGVLGASFASHGGGGGKNYDSENEEGGPANGGPVGLLMNQSKLKMHSRQGTCVVDQKKLLQLPLSVNNGSISGKPSQNPLRSSQSQLGNQGDKAATGSGGGATVLHGGHSDNTSNSAAVVVMSQASNTLQQPVVARRLSLTESTQQLPLVQPAAARLMIDLFESEVVGGNPQVVDETDLETGVSKRKQQQPDAFLPSFSSEQLDTDYLLLSEQHTTQQNNVSDSANNTEALKRNIMKRLIEIMEEDDSKPQQPQTNQILSDGSEKLIHKGEAAKTTATPTIQRSIEKSGDPKFESMQQHISGGKHQQMSQSSSKPSARRNTRYGEPEESLIQFDLTVDQRDEDDISLIMVKKGGENGQLTRRGELNRVKDVLPVNKGSDSDHAPMLANIPNNQRKSFKLQIQEQIQSIIVSETSSSQTFLAKPSPKKVKSSLNMSEIQAEMMPLVMLKNAFHSVSLCGEATHRIEPDRMHSEVVASSLLGKKFKLPSAQAQEKVGGGGESLLPQNKAIATQRTNVERTVSEMDGNQEEVDTQSLGSEIQIATNLPHSSEEVKEVVHQIKPSTQVFQYVAAPVPQRDISPVNISNNFWNPTAPSPTRTLPPLLKLPNSEDEGEAATGRRRSGHYMRDIFYQQPPPQVDSGRRGSSLEGAEETTEFHLGREGSNGPHNRSTATPLFAYQTSSDEEGSGTRAAKVRPQKIMRLLTKYGGGGNTTSAIPNAPSPSRGNSKGRPTTTEEQQPRPSSKPKDVSFRAGGGGAGNKSAHTDRSERLKENLKAFTKNKLLSSVKKGETTNVDQLAKDLQKHSK